MLHESLPNHELFEEREVAARNLGNAALFLESVMYYHREACVNNTLSDELRDQANDAGREYNNAIGWLQDVHKRIHEAGL